MGYNHHLMNHPANTLQDADHPVVINANEVYLFAPCGDLAVYFPESEPEVDDPKPNKPEAKNPESDPEKKNLFVPEDDSRVETSNTEPKDEVLYTRGESEPNCVPDGDAEQEMLGRRKDEGSNTTERVEESEQDTDTTGTCDNSAPKADGQTLLTLDLSSLQVSIDVKTGQATLLGRPLSLSNPA